MSRRRYVVAVECSHPGCRASSNFEAETQREAARTRSHYVGRWKCSDHRDLDIRMGPKRMKTIHRSVATDLDVPGCLFWVADGASSGSGFSHGPGFTARAEEWPEGTVLEVTARIILPGEKGSLSQNVTETSRAVTSGHEASGAQP